MARPLRIDVADGFCHVSGRGIERRNIFLGKSYYMHFLELLEEMSARYGVEVHAYCLMGNHFLCGAPHKKWFVMQTNM